MKILALNVPQPLREGPWCCSPCAQGRVATRRFLTLSFCRRGAVILSAAFLIAAQTRIALFCFWNANGTAALSCVDGEGVNHLFCRPHRMPCASS